LKPVVYSFKDRGPLAFGNHGKLIEWNGARQRLNAILARPSERERLSGLMDFAVDRGADYLLVNFDTERTGGEKGKGNLVFHNTMYSVFKLRKAQ
jgi:hypothetical protein